MFSEFKGAVKDVFSSKIIGLIGLSVVLTLVVFVLLFFCFYHAMSFFELSDMPKLEKSLEILGYMLFFIFSLMLFPSVITLISGFFVDSVVERMARADNIHILRNVPLSESLLISGILAVKGISVSMVLIPVTLLFGWIPFVNFLPVALYYILNGRLLAKEYFLAVALRYTEKQKAEDLFNAYRLYWIKAGIIIAVLMTIPVVNTISPLVAIAFMQRLFLKKNPNREKA